MPQSIPGAAARRRRMILATAFIAGAPVAAVISVAVIYGPAWFPSTPGIQADARWYSQELGRNRTAILAAIAGSLAAVGASYTALNFRLSRRSHITDRFFKAVELVDPARPASVRLGGIYALEAVAAESPADIQVVLNVLQAYRTSESTPDLDRAAAEDVISRLEWTPFENSVRDRSRAIATVWKIATPSFVLFVGSVWLVDETGTPALVIPCLLASTLFGAVTGRTLQQAMRTLYAPLPNHQTLDHQRRDQQSE